MFDLTVISPKRVIFNDAASRIYLDGKDADFEILSFHAHLVGILRKGRLVIDNNKGILLNKGIVKFYENKCVVLIEEPGTE